MIEFLNNFSVIKYVTANSDSKWDKNAQIITNKFETTEITDSDVSNVIN